MVRKIFAIISVLVLILGAGCIEYAPSPENGEKENKQPEGGGA